MFQIEDSVPVPVVERAVYPFAQMLIGQSFLLPVPNEATPEKQAEALSDIASKARNAAYQFAKKANAKLTAGEPEYYFLLRAVEIDSGVNDPETNEPIMVKGYRCWRTERPAKPAKTATEPENAQTEIEAQAAA